MSSWFRLPLVILISPGIMTLGYIAAFSETLALAVVVSKGATGPAALSGSRGTKIVWTDFRCMSSSAL